MDISTNYEQNRERLIRKAQHSFGLPWTTAEDHVDDAADGIEAIESRFPAINVWWHRVRSKVSAAARRRELERKSRRRLARPKAIEHKFIMRDAHVNRSDWPEDELKAWAAWRVDQKQSHVAKVNKWTLTETKRVLSRVAARLSI